MARWASTNLDHAAGSICGHPVFRSAGEFDLCHHHYWRMIDYRYWDKPLEDIKEKIRALSEADAEYAELVRESEVHRERVRAAVSVVYYLRRVSDGAIKIGTTTEFRKRMATHRKEHGEIQILLTHSGTAKEEHEIHLKFDVYRIGRGRTEWFYPTRPLLNWILSTRSVERHKKTQGLDILPQAEDPEAHRGNTGRCLSVAPGPSRAQEGSCRTCRLAPCDPDLMARIWIELPAGSGWGDARVAASALHKLGYVTEEQRGAGFTLLRLSGARLDRAALWRLPGQR